MKVTCKLIELSMLSSWECHVPSGHKIGEESAGVTKLEQVYTCKAGKVSKSSHSVTKALLKVCLAMYPWDKILAGGTLYSLCTANNTSILSKIMKQREVSKLIMS